MILMGIFSEILEYNYNIQRNVSINHAKNGKISVYFKGILLEFFNSKLLKVKYLPTIISTHKNLEIPIPNIEAKRRPNKQ